MHERAVLDYGRLEISRKWGIVNKKDMNIYPGSKRIIFY
jgi:hypothetical protein